MDTDIDLFIESPSRPAEAFLEVQLLFEQQEQRFSRFRESSLLSRFNRGEPISDGWFVAGIELALAAFDESGGLFNPMVLPALSTAGYDRTFAEVAGGVPVSIAVPNPHEAVVVTPEGARLISGQVDLGGIVKGWSVDLAVEHLLPTTPNVFLNAGGDIRCAGSDGEGPGWAMEIEGPRDSTPWSGRLTGGIATSSTLKRRWKTTTGESAHHLIDPRTGMPARSPFAQVTSRAASCRRAEVWAKAVLIGGEPAMAAAAAAGVPVLACAEDGEVSRQGDW